MENLLTTAYESLIAYPVNITIGISTLVIYNSFKINKINKKMEKLTEVTEIVAKPVLTLEQVDLLITERTAGIMQIIKENESEDGLTREGLNHVINKVNETLLIQTTPVKLQPVEETAPEAETPVEETAPEAETPVEETAPEAETPVAETAPESEQNQTPAE